ncbi:MAG: 3-phosphoserine/phosphohydroxythreonine transaminase [Vicinamibacterales bacterium]
MSITTPTRVFNFSAGPAVLPVPVLDEIQRDMLALPGVGMSILEVSHRSKAFESILDEAMADARTLTKAPANYHILFLQGGASLQFSMVPMNLLGAGQTADYVITGSWGEKALKEAKRVGTVNLAANTGPEFRRLPAAGELKLTPGAAYVHTTSNETIQGVEFSDYPSTGDVPHVCDTSSNMFSKPIDVTKYGLIYAGAQKNLGPAGVTLVIVRDDLLARSPATLSTMLNYNTFAKERSLYNTPPCFAIYVVGLVFKWLLANGGLEGAAERNERKAAKLYTEIDRTGFYRGHADKACRSNMNVTFRLPSEDLEKLFVKESSAAGLDGLKGHRSVGGLRASIYNAFPESGIDVLVEFMREFERKNG